MVRLTRIYTALRRLAKKATNRAQTFIDMRGFSSVDQLAYKEALPGKFAVIYFAPPKSGSLILIPVFQHDYNGYHPRKSDAAKRRAMLNVPQGVVAFKAYARRTDGTVGNASPLHFYDGDPMSIQKADMGHPDIRLIKKHLPKTQHVVLVGDRYYPMQVVLDDKGEPKRAAFRTPVIENDIAPR